MGDKKWMRIYETVEEALSDIHQTQHEKEENIQLTGNNRISDDWGDLKVVKVGKSTGEDGIFLLYKPYKDKSRWVLWCPSGEQQKNLKFAASILEGQDKHNSQFWGDKNETKG